METLICEDVNYEVQSADQDLMISELPEESTISEWFSGNLGDDYLKMVKEKFNCYNEYAIYVRYSDGPC